MANNLKDFTWFDKPATADSARQLGGLSILGRTLQGIAAPFASAYGNNFGIEQMKLQQQQDEANMEFQKYLMRNKIDTAELGIKQKSADFQDKLMSMYFGNGNSPLNPPEATSPDSMSMLNSPLLSGGIDASSPSPSSLFPSLGGGVPMSLLGMSGGKPRFGLDPVQVAIAKAAQGKIVGDKLEAGKAVARDTAIYGMMEGVMGDLMGLYDSAGGFSGDVLRAGAGSLAATGKLPKEITDKMNPKELQAVAEFTARRNEIMTRMQPLLSEQFGKEGSNRIMESLLALTEKEVAKLSDPRIAAVGKTVGTLKNFYRFAKASSDYADKVGVTADAVMSMKSAELNQFVTKALQSKPGKLTADDEKYFSTLERSFLKNKITPEEARAELERRKKNGK